MSLSYHLDKTNIIVDALRSSPMGRLSYIDEEKRGLVKGIHRFANFRVCLLNSKNAGVIFQEVVKSSLSDEVKEKQALDPIHMQIKDNVGQKRVMDLKIRGDSILRYHGRLCVAHVDRMEERILTKSHESMYTVHPGSTKMYHNLKEIYWWNNIKRDVTNFVAKCIVCQQVKVEHLRLGGIFHELEFPIWK